MTKEMKVVEKDVKTVKTKNIKKKTKDGAVKLPISHTVIASVLALIMGIGGTYGGIFLYDSPKIIVSAGPGYDEVLHTVTRIRDPDTIVLDDENAVVRMLGVDAPEEGSCFYEEANAYVTQLLLGKQVLLRKDSQTYDDFGRLLRYVFVYDDDARHDNIFVNNVLVEQGFAYSDHQGVNRMHESLLNNSMGLARKAKRGLHEVCVNREDVVVEPTDPKCLIKGNHSPATGKDLYFLPGCQNHDTIIMKEIDGDQYFCTEEEAVEAGFKIAGNCKTRVNLETESE